MTTLDTAIWLTYHEISDRDPRYRYAVAADAFRAHLGSIANREPSKCFITFDDGGLSQYEFGLPILAEYGFRAQFFITAGWIGRRPGYMTISHLREIVAHGHEVQSHSWSHPRLTRCTDKQLNAELVRSRLTLEDITGTAVTGISIPGGRWDDRVVRFCRRHGYQRVYTSDPFQGPVTKDGVEFVGRFMVTRHTRPRHLARFATARLHPLHPMRAVYALKSVVRSTIPDRLYQSVWDFVASKPAEPSRADHWGTS